MILYKLQDLILMSPAKRNKVILVNIILSLLINIVVWVAFIVVFRGSDEYIVLGYNMYFGISSLGPWYQILIMPAIGAFVILLNFGLCFYLYLKDRTLSYFLAVATSVFNVLMALASFILIYVNI
jgi:hypothetical protein